MRSIKIPLFLPERLTKFSGKKLMVGDVRLDIPCNHQTLIPQGVTKFDLAVGELGIKSPFSGKCIDWVAYDCTPRGA